VNSSGSTRRLCIVSSAPPSSLETFIKAHLDQLPFDTTYLCAAAGRFWHDGTDISEAYNAEITSNFWALNLLPRVIEFRIRNRFASGLTTVEGLARFLREGGFDAVLAEYGPVAVEVMEACKLASVPLIAHFHGYDASRTDILSRYQRGYDAMFDYASAVIVVSRPMHDRIVQAGCPVDKLILTACGPNEMFYSVEPSYSSNTILMVGRLVEKKAPHLSILAFSKALSKHEGLRMRVVGDGPLVGVCRDLVDACAIADSVDFPGPLKPDEIKFEMSNAFLFTQHSVTADDGDTEGTPVAILEAAAAGLPVVATRHGGIPDAVLDQVTGYLVRERDVSGAADAMIKLARDRNLVRSMGNAARKHISANFALKKHIDELANVIDRAITG
jgi:glycosyltransferase involved in cell wall biosynthesis